MTTHDVSTLRPEFWVMRIVAEFRPFGKQPAKWRHVNDTPCTDIEVAIIRDRIVREDFATDGKRVLEPIEVYEEQAQAIERMEREQAKHPGNRYLVTLSVQVPDA